MKAVTGSDLLIESLQTSGVTCVYGVPGTQTVPIFEALRRSRIRTILCASETAAAFMAGGHARATGVAGVCLTIPGPGFTMALTGIAEAHLDSVPLLFISGAPADHPAARRFRQQELDQRQIASPLCRGVHTVATPEEIPIAVANAMRHTVAGEPGPVLLQLSAAAMGGFAGTPRMREEVSGESGAVTTPAGDLNALRDAVRGARRPVLLVGQGGRFSAREIAQLAERLHAPVVTTGAGRGVLPEDHPLCMAFDSTAGGVEAVNQLCAAADLILTLGAKLGHNGSAGFNLRIPPASHARVDMSADALVANYPAHVSVNCSVREAVACLLGSDLAISAWQPEELDSWKGLLSNRLDSVLEPRIGGTPSGTAAAFFAALRSAMARDGVLVVDSGLHQLMARRHFSVLSAGGFVFPSDLQSMGFALPTAIGHRLASPDRQVVALLGDGGFMMSGFELVTAVREGVDLVAIVFNDGGLGQIRMQQYREYGVACATDLGQMHIASIVSGMGARHVDGGDAIGDAVAAALAEGGVTVIEVRVSDAVGTVARAVGTRLKERAKRLAGGRLTSAIKRLLR